MASTTLNGTTNTHSMTPLEAIRWAFAQVQSAEEFNALLDAAGPAAEGTAKRLGLVSKGGVYIPAPVAVAIPPVPLSRDDFDGLAGEKLPGWEKVSPSVKLRTWALFTVSGMDVSDFLAMPKDGRQALSVRLKDRVEEELKKLAPAPAQESTSDKPAPATKRGKAPAKAQQGGAKSSTPADPWAGRDGHVKLRRAVAEAEGLAKLPQAPKSELLARLEMAKGKPAPAPKDTNPNVPGLFVPDGKGGYRPATLEEVKLALAAMTQ